MLKLRKWQQQRSFKPRRYIHPIERQNLDRKMVVNIAEEYRLNITIRPDGSIFGFKESMDKLRHETQCRCEMCRMYE